MVVGYKLQILTSAKNDSISQREQNGANFSFIAPSIEKYIKGSQTMTSYLLRVISRSEFLTVQLIQWELICSMGVGYTGVDLVVPIRVSE